MTSAWRRNAGTVFECEKGPATGRWGMAVSNNALASAAGAGAIAAGGNAVDAAITSLFALYVVEPMMVGLLGGGTTHIRTPQGDHLVLDGLCTAPMAARADMFEPRDTEEFVFTDVRDRENTLGAKAVCVPGTLAAVCELADRFACLPLETLMAPALRYASHGFLVTPYLADYIVACAPDIAQDPHLASLLIPDGRPIAAGERLVQGTLAETLRLIAREGAAALYRGEIGDKVVDHMASRGGLLSREDLRNYRTVERAPVRGTYRGFEIFGPPPPVSSGVHIVQMLNILEGYDIGGLGFGTPESLHLILEATKIAFADRTAFTGDPAFVDVPIERLVSKDYAEQRRRDIDLTRAREHTCDSVAESRDTTHVTMADAEGWVVSATHTIWGDFGANFLVPELGLIGNNAMMDFDPRPGRAQSIAPGKRTTSSQSPLIVVKEGQPRYALGMVGGLRIFPSVMQTLLNLIDHGMSLQEAVEAPRIWTQGYDVEAEPAFPEVIVASLAALGHKVSRAVVGHGMNAIAFHEGGRIEGAGCWRADGTPVGIGTGLARGYVPG